MKDQDALSLEDKMKLYASLHELLSEEEREHALFPLESQAKKFLSESLTKWLTQGSNSIIVDLVRNSLNERVYIYQDGDGDFYCRPAEGEQRKRTVVREFLKFSIGWKEQAGGKQPVFYFVRPREDEETGNFELQFFNAQRVRYSLNSDNVLITYNSIPEGTIEVPKEMIHEETD